MITLSEFVRMFYAPSFLYGVRSINTISEYATSLDYYIRYVGDIPLNEINPATNIETYNQFVAKIARTRAFWTPTGIDHKRWRSTTPPSAFKTQG